MIRTPRQLAADQMVAEFRHSFYEKFGIYPNVAFNLRGNVSKNLSLNELLILVDKALLDNHDSYVARKVKAIEEREVGGGLGKARDFFKRQVRPISIKSSQRLSHVVDYRFVFYKLARELGYNVATIGEAVGHDHSTVIYGIRRINQLIILNDIDCIIALKNVQNNIDNYIADEEIHIPVRESQPQS